MLHMASAIFNRFVDASLYIYEMLNLKVTVELFITLFLIQEIVLAKLESVY